MSDDLLALLAITNDLDLKPAGPSNCFGVITSAAVNKARNEGNNMPRSSPDIVAMAEIIGRHLAASVTGNNQPHMSGDPRNRIQPVRRRHFDEACQSAAEAICASLTTTGSDAVAGDEAYEIGKRDGYEDAIQDLDLATGGDGEFKGSTTPGGTVDVPAMKARIIARLSR